MKKKLFVIVECGCGYIWKSFIVDLKDVLCLKEGFWLIVWFFVKLYYSRDGYGCVLCILSGKSEKYDGVE